MISAEPPEDWEQVERAERAADLGEQKKRPHLPCIPDTLQQLLVY